MHAVADDPIAILRAALPELRMTWPIGSLAVFGSRARADATIGSDLDILVEFMQPIPLSSFLALEERLSSLTQLKVDLVSAAALKPFMAERVRAKAIPL